MALGFLMVEPKSGELEVKAASSSRGETSLYAMHRSDSL